MTARTDPGWEGWDAYAPFYDWENARTVARRDVRFWQRLAAAQDGPVLELGCGTGRVLAPVMRAGVDLVGIDRSAEMLARARQRLRRARLLRRGRLVRGDIRHLPFRCRPGFSLVMAPYGILQSLTREADLKATLASVASVLRRGGLFGIDLVPDLPRWSEYNASRACQAGAGTAICAWSSRSGRIAGADSPSSTRSTPSAAVATSGCIASR
jgi:SAM-dependent methyltransferase